MGGLSTVPCRARLRAVRIEHRALNSAVPPAPGRGSETGKQREGVAGGSHWDPTNDGRAALYGGDLSGCWLLILVMKEGKKGTPTERFLGLRRTAIYLFYVLAIRTGKHGTFDVNL